MDRKITCLWKEPRAAESYKTAVSLHGHTLYSHESLNFISESANKVCFLRWVMAALERKAVREASVPFDFDRAFWTPPLTPSAAFEIESRQITEHLGLNSIVSLTDHDSIEAPLLLRVHKDTADVPISTEWSVPFHGGELHLGVHNLPADEAEDILAAMHAYTANPSPQALKELLAELHSRKDVLIVLNHPFWDVVGAGREIHYEAVLSFMAAMGQYVHAFELGGLRGWEENRKTFDFAEQWNVTVISGGDRHGCEPSGVLNLTNAGSLTEFIAEIRRKKSHVLFMPQYAKPLWTRMLQVVLDVTEPQPSHQLGEHWDDRTFHPDKTGALRPLSGLWKRRPSYIETVFAGFRLLENDAIRQAIASHVRRKQQMPFLFGQEEA